MARHLLSLHRSRIRSILRWHNDTLGHPPMTLRFIMSPGSTNPTFRILLDETDTGWRIIKQPRWTLVDDEGNATSLHTDRHFEAFEAARRAFLDEGRKVASDL